MPRISRRVLFCMLAAAAVVVLGFPLTAAATEYPPRGSVAEPLSPPAINGVVCTPGRVWRWRQSCPGNGPATTDYRISHIRLPDPLPELPLVEMEVDPEEDVVPFTFAYVRTLPLSIYRHPLEAALGLPPVRILYSGDQWVSVDGEVEYEGARWYQINPSEFVSADALAIGRPSRFQGVYLNEQPAYSFAWINRLTRPARTPQAAPDESAPLYQRYQLVTIYAQELRGDEIWYLIGPEQWVEQSHVSRVTVDPPPAGVGEGRWIEVDLFEQTIALYQGTRMVYATLISSGRPGSTWTDSGVFRIWLKLDAGKMSNPDVQDGSPAWYYLEDVPWTLYFNGPTALHTAYWHDAFGFTRSHGCVNLAPRDAEWIYHWASVGDTVWVHNTSPFGE
ncbi:MAG: L,D-transpeptidase [Anaerolineae bacterium]|nr:L,D-transpeptidase [Anaerolineae bacterium]